MVMGRNGYGPKWSWAEMVMGRNDPESLNPHFYIVKWVYIFSSVCSKHRLLVHFRTAIFIFFSHFYENKRGHSLEPTAKVIRRRVIENVFPFGMLDCGVYISRNGIDNNTKNKLLLFCACIVKEEVTNFVSATCVYVL